MRSLHVALGLATLVAASSVGPWGCSGSETSSGNSSSDGASSVATGNQNPSGGGAGGAGGASGTATTTSSTTASSASSASSTGSGVTAAAECSDSSQCTLVNDCCSCEALPVLEPKPKCEAQNCLVDTCTSLGVMPGTPTCSAGHCTLFDCDHAKVMCKKAQPVCGPGETVAVENQCWAGCVPATQCIAVASCAQCDAKTQACVTEVFKGGPKIHCVDIAPTCNGKPTCACMGKAVCTGSFDVCNDVPDGIECGCTKC